MVIDDGNLYDNLLLSFLNSHNLVNMFITNVRLACALNGSNTECNFLGDILLDNSNIDMATGLNDCVSHTFETNGWVLGVNLADIFRASLTSSSLDFKEILGCTQSGLLSGGKSFE